MSYKSLLVQLDASTAAEARLDLALRLARQFGAHLTAVLTVFRPESASYYAMGAAAQYLAERDQWVGERRTVFARHFSAETARLDVPGEWLSTQAYANQEVPRLSRLADLTIAGQTDPDDPDSVVADRFPENLVLSSGRPVLFVPYAGTFPTVGTRVLVAWDGSREAARALRDGLPFLVRAEHTTVVTVNALEKENEPPARRRHRRRAGASWRARRDRSDRGRARHGDRRNAALPRRGPLRRPDRDGRLRSLALARAGARRRDAVVAEIDDRAGADVALTGRAMQDAKCVVRATIDSNQRPARRLGGRRR